MKEPFAHNMMPRAASDERARQNFVAGLKMHMEDNVYPSDRKVGVTRVLPSFKAAHGRAPNSSVELRHAIEADPFFQSWSSIARSIQEMGWDAVSEIVSHELPRLLEKSKISNPKGSLHLEPNVEVPLYNTAIDIHCMPGGYHSEITEDDVFAGAMFDRGAHYYGLAIRGTAALDYVDTRERIARAAPGYTTIDFLRKTYPGFKPKRILDMGCAIGGTTVPYAEEFPAAKVYGVDVAAPQLRYAHARAESLGARVHFRQENAEALSFEDDSFDLVVSHGLFHETSAKATPRILAETHRVLREGGVTIHVDTQFARGLDDLDDAYWDWDAHYNSEPFWSALHHTDARDLLANAGFQRSSIREVWPLLQRNGSTAYEPVTDTGGKITGSTIFSADKR